MGASTAAGIIPGMALMAVPGAGLIQTHLALRGIRRDRRADGTHPRPRRPI